MWYQRMPDLYVDLTKGWEGISLPFTAELVSTQQKGEITHFYSGSRSIDGNGTKIGHEYWLREYIGGSVDPSNANIFKATLNYPTASGDAKQVDNTFLWDYYYSLNAQQDANTDTYTYQTYYQSGRSLANYPLLANGKPYIIGFPGKTYYEFDLSGEWTAKNTAAPAPAQLNKQVISFVSKPAITIGISDDELNAVTAETNYSFMPNYMSKEVKGYFMNTEGNSFDKAKSTTVPTTEIAVATVPFRPYFVTTAPSGSRQAASQILFDSADSFFAIGDNDPSKEEITGELVFFTKHHQIGVTSSLREAADVQIYNMNGHILSSFTVLPGETVEKDVPITAVYIVRAAGGRYTKKLAVK